MLEHIHALVKHSESRQTAVLRGRGRQSQAHLSLVAWPRMADAEVGLVFPASLPPWSATNLNVGALDVQPLASRGARGQQYSRCSRGCKVACSKMTSIRSCEPSYRKTLTGRAASSMSRKNANRRSRLCQKDQFLQRQAGTNVAGIEADAGTLLCHMLMRPPSHSVSQVVLISCDVMEELPWPSKRHVKSASFRRVDGASLRCPCSTARALMQELELLCDAIEWQ